MDRKELSDRPRLFVLAGPTAVGKGTVAAWVREHSPAVHISVSATTRQPRPGEVDGYHYHFLSEAEFDAKLAAGEFLEWAYVHGATRYGTLRGPVEEALTQEHPVLLEIDLAGARQVRSAMPEAVMVFLAPPSWEELVRRLQGRGTETEEQQTRRLETAMIELAAASEFDVTIVNDTVDAAAQALLNLMGVQPDAQECSA